MIDFQHELEKALRQNDKPQAHHLINDWLNTPERLILFYEKIIPAMMNSIDCAPDDYACIWVEHQMSAIVRSLVEATYPLVVKYQCELTPARHVMIACIKEETHELGAVIGSHLFALNGFETTYIGANTPLMILDSALRGLPHVDYLVLSVTNAYNIVELNKVTSHLNKHFPKLKIYAAGRGISRNQNSVKLDGIVAGSADILQLIEQEGLTCSPSK
ncbi:MAG: hypothetical protein EA374_04605 [Acholeplasmatales bacterium]|nr:MAG: hypothetical protein EA374_04605 [Acholeplasmatales bacterium]